MLEYQNLSDTELIPLLNASDHAVYTEIYKRYCGLMLSHAYRKLGDEEQSKDFVQELFIKLWNKRKIINPELNLGALLHTMLKNQILDFFIHQKVRSRYIDYLKDHLPGVPYTATTDHLVREKQLGSHIDEQIEALPAKMRQVFQLSRKDQLSNKEIAELLNTTESNISKRISSAVKILKTKLGGVFTL